MNVSRRSSSSSFVFVIVVAARVIARELVDVGQRLERSHAVEEQDAVEVIGFVLDDAGRELAGLELDALALAIERADLDLERARHLAADVGNAQAALPALDDLLADDLDLGVDDRERPALASAVGIEMGDENAKALDAPAARRARPLSTRASSRSCRR